MMGAAGFEPAAAWSEPTFAGRAALTRRSTQNLEKNRFGPSDYRAR